ncbi:hypothetical protein I307_05747 [Cryptococcus deuterogattii 99/473]|uniref:RRM domain-containing protein n=2 Tax=Cryptococcus deuterogattii TaxID=1859096 RepID=A0A0D0SWJ0_9TREE|nr:hypothetical protein CNBG_6098 [Cryptococcus deuterogattii R265]KIR25534.1 hypothetical protein I309_05589 [Cryptococcus deuterogattii LA55]KIR31219.1 hypothetical protein I352_06500 [Cryptococcus deuterogattii MMRL2647]KIR37522.1 hypothetical protein I313_06523 [Cryptococcus deuterogattii Ram5]KIR69814.1 hypothetical protein I310_06378 [Cryptococcus deuterogattii CA1014]KIR89778.1 hypothetical protein I304_06498 [Cryptococcus deuterogattii CBS 10090]KIR96149.1 hypothetical protein L804_06
MAILSTPSPTLYVSGLETKTKKQELKQQLYALFSPYGRVIDVVAKKHDGGRGQAFVVFEEQVAATAALRALTGETFYNKELRISYAQKPSYATTTRQDPSASREAAAIQAAKLTVSRAQDEYEQLEKERHDEEAGLLGEKRGLEDGDEERGAKRVKQEDDEAMEIEMDEDEDEEKPVLICSNLPAECNAEIMGALFSQYQGFISATQLPSSFTPPSSHPKPNPGAISFNATFQSRDQAAKAKDEVNGYLMQPGWAMTATLA